MQELFAIILNIIAPIFIIIGMSIFIGRRFKPDVRTLSTLLIYVFIPALVFEGISKTALDLVTLGQIGVIVVGVMVGVVILTTLSIRLGIFGAVSQKTESGLILSVLLMNAANYGIPVNEFAFGEEGGQLAIIFYVLSVIVGNILGVYYASRGTAGITKAVKNVLTVPITYAALLGLLVNFGNISIPLAITRSLDILAEATIPVMLILLGITLAGIQLKGRIRPVLLATGIKLLIAPLIAVPLSLLVGLSGVPQHVMIIQSAMPTAVLASALAVQFESDVDMVTSITLLSTLLSIITLSVLLLLVGGVAV